MKTKPLNENNKGETKMELNEIRYFEKGKKIADLKPDCWNIMMRIPCETSSIQKIIDGIRAYTDFYDVYEETTDDDEATAVGEIEESLRTGWISVCDDGVVIWIDGE